MSLLGIFSSMTTDKSRDDNMNTVYFINWKILLVCSIDTVKRQWKLPTDKIQQRNSEQTSNVTVLKCAINTERNKS